MALPKLYYSQKLAPVSILDNSKEPLGINTLINA
jgi:hypothetical protein